MGFESWVSESSVFGNYDEPAGGVWTTANKVVRLGFPATTFKTTDSHTGNYAAKLVTASISIINPPLLVSGILATGVFNDTGTPPDNLKLGKPFTGRPDRFSAYFKYVSVSGDSCAMFILLSKWNATAAMRDTIGYLLHSVDYDVNIYTLFDHPIQYYSGAVPDSITIVFASSAGGAELKGAVGSTLYLDDVELQFASGISMDLFASKEVKLFPSPAGKYILIESVSKPEEIRIFNQLGTLCAVHYPAYFPFRISLEALQPGIYFLSIDGSGLGNRFVIVP